MRYLDLSAWPVAQRPRLLQEIRRMASETELSKDPNIDAFINRLNTPELRAYSDPALASARSNSYRAWAEASGELDRLIVNDPSLRETPLGNIINDAALLEKRPDLRHAIENVQTTENAYERLLQTHLAQTNVESGLSRSLNQLATDAALPRFTGVEVKTDNRNGWYQSNRMGLAEEVVSTGHSAETADTALHEFVHHELRPGFWRGLVGDAPPEGNPFGEQFELVRELELLSRPNGTLNLLTRIGTSPRTARTLSVDGSVPTNIRFFAEQARTGNINTSTWDEALTRSQLTDLLEQRIASTREECWRNQMNYVGTFNEIPAWSTGFLARLRARAMGLPDAPGRQRGLPETISLRNFLKPDG